MKAYNKSKKFNRTERGKFWKNGKTISRTVYFWDGLKSELTYKKKNGYIYISEYGATFLKLKYNSNVDDDSVLWEYITK